MVSVIEHFARDTGLPVNLVKWFKATAELAAEAGVQTCNTGDDRCELMWGRIIEEVANVYGFTVSWPGLYPVLYRNGYAYHLPD